MIVHEKIDVYFLSKRYFDLLLLIRDDSNFTISLNKLLKACKIILMTELVLIWITRNLRSFAKKHGNKNKGNLKTTVQMKKKNIGFVLKAKRTKSFQPEKDPLRKNSFFCRSKREKTLLFCYKFHPKVYQTFVFFFAIKILRDCRPFFPNKVVVIYPLFFYDQKNERHRSINRFLLLFVSNISIN